MSDYSFSKKEMLEPIQRLFEREYAENFGMFEDMLGGSDVDFDQTDAVFIGGSRKAMHVIDIHEDYDSCLFEIDGGIHTLAKVDANYHWIALSLDELRDGENRHSGILEEECESRGLGIITLQPKGRGISAKVIQEPEYTEGEFLDQYPELDRHWKSFTEKGSRVEDYKVVNYYDQ